MKWMLPALFCLSMLQAETQVKLTINKKLIRINSPCQLEVSFTTTKSTKGKLSFFYDNDALFYRSKDIILTAGKNNKYLFWLPPLKTSYYRVFFETQNKKINLGSRDLGQVVDLLITTTFTKNTPLERACNITSLLPQTSNGKNMTAYRRILLEDLPSNVITAYHNTDIILIHSSFLSLMTEEHLNTLDKWILMGGSACFVINKDNLFQQHHRNFISKISSTNNIHNLSNIVTTYRHGWGRAMICNFLQKPYDDFSSLNWQKTILWLWKIRSSVIKEIVDGRINLIENLSYYQEIANWRNDFRYRNYSGGASSKIGNYLLPKSIQIPPTMLLALLLVLFLIFVGPIEYFVLKKMNKRVLTWITFPIATLCFWLVCQWIASLYLSDVKSSKTIFIVDVDSQKRTVRYNELNFFMSSMPKQITNKLENAIQANLETSIDYYRDNVVNDNCSYEGAFPSEFSVTQNLRKWSPYLRRIVKQGTPFPFEGNFETVLKNMHLSQSVRMYKSYYNRRSHSNHRATKFYPEIQEFDRVYVIHQGHVYYIKGQSNDMDRGIFQFTYSPPEGKRILFSQRSPSGGSDASTDLTVHDTTNPLQYIFILVREEQERIIVFRYLFYKGA
ncbi:hypothetical protein [Candidatus Uabimicrobium sp. HlEnr_7]|uniref:hypothetical protein n=1 Tax=Candidatus Uabimicrobium helgolandensis TaxID=3095367 RepID=UPI003558DA0B